VKEVVLLHTEIPAESLAELLRVTESLEELCINWSRIASTGGQVANVLKSGFERNSTLEHLKVCVDNTGVMAPLLRAAASLSKLRELDIHKIHNARESAVEAAASVGHFLESSGSIETLRFHYCEWKQES
jgi:hypothetical protein